MEEKGARKQKDDSDTTKINIARNTSGIFGFSLMIVVALILFFILDRSVYGLQRFIYQRPGEILIGSGTIVIGILALIIGLDFFILDFFYNTGEKYFPKFFYTYCYDKNTKLQLDERIYRKLKIVLLGVLVFGICVVYFFFNEYLILGDKYIAASSMSMVSNRQQYNYSDVKIWKKLRTDSKYSWLYIYEFPSGKKIGDFGSQLEGNNIELIKMIQDKQRKLGFNVSSVNSGNPTKKLTTPIRFLSYLIWASMFFFIPWTLKKLFKRKE